jgi:hypothetical protein
MTLVDRYESIACVEITGIRKQVVAFYFQRLCRSSSGEAEKNNQKPVKTIGLLDGYLPFADQEEGHRFSAIAPSTFVETYCCGGKKHNRQIRK